MSPVGTVLPRRGPHKKFALSFVLLLGECVCVQNFFPDTSIRVGAGTPSLHTHRKFFVTGIISLLKMTRLPLSPCVSSYRRDHSLTTPQDKCGRETPQVIARLIPRELTFFQMAFVVTGNSKSVIFILLPPSSRFLDEHAFISF